MYWPVGTPRIYATSSSRPPQHNGGDDDATPFSLVVSDDGAAAAHRRHSRVGSTGSSISGIATQGGVLARTSASGLSLTSLEATDQQPGGGAGDTSQVPPTPLTPAVKSVEHHGDEHHDSAAVSGSEDEDSDGGQRPARPRRASAATIPDSIPSAEPILALRLSRRGDIFATITATSMTVWQTKVGMGWVRRTVGPVNQLSLGLLGLPC